MTGVFIPHEIRPFEAKDSSQAPLVQHVNSKYVRFVDCQAYLKTVAERPKQIRVQHSE